jgi:hypothetical protein
MGALGLQEVSKPSTSETEVSLGTLAELTGFPVDYIKRELLLDGDSESTVNMDELRQRVLSYLDSDF